MDYFKENGLFNSPGGHASFPKAGIKKIFREMTSLNFPLKYETDVIVV